MNIFKQLTINLPLCDFLLQVPKYTKYLKEMLMRKRKVDKASTHTLGEECSAILIIKDKLPKKLEDSESFFSLA